MDKFWRNKKILVTGHEGFLGANLVKALLGCGCKVIGIDKVIDRPLSVLTGLRDKITAIKADISDFDIVRGIIDSEEPNIIFHLAAEAIVGRAKKEPLTVFRSNVEGTWNILEACRDKRFVECIIVASSDKAYGTSAELPYKEDTPLRGLHTYDASKSCEDIIAQTYFHSYGLPVSVMRCGNIFGPGDFNFSRLIPDAIRCAIRSEKFVIRSDGTFTRDYIFIDDVVAGYMVLAEKLPELKLGGEAFNLSNQEPFTVLEVFEKVEKVFGTELTPPDILDQAKDEIHDQYLSAEKAKQILGWKPVFTFEEGLKETIEWYKGIETGVCGPWLPPSLEKSSVS